jgi:hypothetical protein
MNAIEIIRLQIDLNRVDIGFIWMIGGHPIIKRQKIQEATACTTREISHRFCRIWR